MFDRQPSRGYVDERGNHSALQRAADVDQVVSVVQIHDDGVVGVDDVVEGQLCKQVPGNRHLHRLWDVRHACARTWSLTDSTIGGAVRQSGTPCSSPAVARLSSRTPTQCEWLS